MMAVKVKIGKKRSQGAEICNILATQCQFDGFHRGKEKLRLIVNFKLSF
jgi:hypothetical protein